MIPHVSIEFTITMDGTHPLLMSNGQMADPLHPPARAIAEIRSKTRKTDADREEMLHLSFLGALYCDPDVGPYLPGDNIQSCLQEAALSQRGMKAKIERGVFISTDVNPLAFKGPRTPEELWEAEQFRFRKMAKTGTGRNAKRVPTMRPIFRQWRCAAHGVLDEGQLDFSELIQVATNAGLYIGLGSWKPRFGRFNATVEKT